MSDSIPQHRPIRRHPSAGNLDARPVLLRQGDAPMPLPPASFPHGAELPSDRVQFGPDLDDGALGRLISGTGPLRGRRVLDLGCGVGASAIALARQGARVIAVEPSPGRLARARHAAEIAEVKVEFHHNDLADLAFLRADSVDLVVAVYSLGGVQDLGRVFRQLHRVMTPDAAVVFSLAHPTALMLEFDPEEQETPYLTRTAWSDQPTAWRAGGDEGVTHLHQIGDLFTTLMRANFRVDSLLEPLPVADGNSVHGSPLSDWVPGTIVVRARKEGS
jgi:ubiquinone/menaquinone biosynthesis C-methylase UbiE